jgi:hypothetical protein
LVWIGATVDTEDLELLMPSLEVCMLPAYVYVLVMCVCLCICVGVNVLYILSYMFTLECNSFFALHIEINN